MRRDGSTGSAGEVGRMFEDTSKTESRRCWFCRRGYLFNREEKSDSGFRRCGRMVRAGSTIFVGFEDDGSRRLGRFLIK